MSDNFYETLGVDEKATQEDIKKAYRRLSYKHHPDKNPNNPEATSMFQKISEAYETLGDPQKRDGYNMARKNPFMRMNNNGNGNPMEVPMDEIFSMFFGGMPGMPGMPGMQGMQGGMGPGGNIHIFHGGPMGGFAQGIQKPSPIVRHLIITMEDVLNGAVVPLDIERSIVENGNKTFEKETVYVTIPQGVDHGEIVILRDKGNIVNETLKGDIKIFVKVNNETAFKRVGLDLVLDKTITLKEALCGFSFEINYINGKSYTLNNSKGNIIPPEYKKVYPNMGLTRGDHKGKMIIHFHLIFPETLSIEQIDKLNEVL